MAKTLRIPRPGNGRAPGLPSAQRKKRIDREGPIHREILAHIRKRLPEAIAHHSPNAVGLSGYRIAKQLHLNEAMGTIKGWPDLTCILPGPVVLFFEVKAPGNYPDKDQKALHEELRSLGARVAVVRSCDDVDDLTAPEAP